MKCEDCNKKLYDCPKCGTKGKKIEDFKAYYCGYSICSLCGSTPSEIHFNYEGKIGGGNFNPSEKLVVRGAGKEEFIDCPFEFEEIFGGLLGMKFDGDRCLFFNRGGWTVGDSFKEDKVKTKVRKELTSKEELEVGKWYVCRRSLDLEEAINKKDLYHLYLGDGVYRYIEVNESVDVSCVSFPYWHEVVKDE